MSFIVRNQELATAIEEQLRGTVFQSPALFLQLYNEGLINKANEKIDTIAKSLPEAYKDVSLSSRQLNLLSEDEVALGEMEDALSLWRAFVLFRHQVKELTTSGALGEGEHLAFSEEHPGVIGAVRQNEEGEVVFVPVSGQVLSNNRVALITSRWGRSYEDRLPGVSLVNREVLSTDTSFIQRMWELLP